MTDIDAVLRETLDDLRLSRSERRALSELLDATPHRDLALWRHRAFALFDARVLLAGSYNWTRAAARENQENVLVTDDERLTDSYRLEFERLWRGLEGLESDVCPVR